MNVKKSNSAEDNSDYSKESSDIYHKVSFDNTIYDIHIDLKRNKQNLKMSSMNLCDGLLAGGFNHGFLCIWDFHKIIKTVYLKKKCLNKMIDYLLFLHAPHLKIIQIIEFSKKKDKLLTGSVDGNVLIWDVKFDVIKKFREGIYSYRTFSPDTADYFVYSLFILGSITENDTVKNPSVNVAIWTCHDNFITAIISSKKKIDNKRSSTLYIYDVHLKEKIMELGNNDGYEIHDECYMLEHHPTKENLILTSCSSNEVIIVDILIKKVIFKFSIKNYFFPNIDDTLLILEGKFFGNGDRFVISTYFGVLSIFSIYEDKGYQGTFLNQFFDVELNNVKGYREDGVNSQDSIDENNNGNLSVSNVVNRGVNNNSVDNILLEREINSNPLIPRFVNMINQPYTYQQPFSILKVRKIERKLLKEGYNYKYIKENLHQNNEGFSMTLEERYSEVIKETMKFEEIYSSSLQQDNPNIIRRRGRRRVVNGNPQNTNLRNANNENNEFRLRQSTNNNFVERISRRNEDLEGVLNTRSQRRERPLFSQNNSGIITSNRENTFVSNFENNAVRNNNATRSNNEVKKKKNNRLKIIDDETIDNESMSEAEDDFDEKNDNEMEEYDDNDENNYVYDNKDESDYDDSFAASDNDIDNRGMYDEDNFIDDDNNFNRPLTRNFKKTNKRIDKKRRKSRRIEKNKNSDDFNYSFVNDELMDLKGYRRRGTRLKNSDTEEALFKVNEDNSRKLRSKSLQRLKKGRQDDEFNKKKNKFIDDDTLDLIENIEDDNNDESECLNDILMTSISLTKECYFCKITSDNLIGPFYISGNNVKLPNINGQAINNNYEDIFIHYKCLVEFNDFKIFKKSKDESIDYIKTIKKNLEVKDSCIRCGGKYPTYRCKHDKCKNKYHSYSCMNYCVDLESGKCYECMPITSNPNQIQSRKNKLNLLRDEFLISSYTYFKFFPQLNMKYMFIPQAYEEYIREHYKRIKYNSQYCLEVINNEKPEILENFFDENKPMKYNDLMKHYFGWRSKINISSIAECEIVDIDYCFAADVNTENGLMIRIKLRIDKKHESKTDDFSSLDRLNTTGIFTRKKAFASVDLEATYDDDNLEILYFRNLLPDFLIDKRVYDKNLGKYLFLNNKKLRFEETPVEIFIDNLLWNAYIKEIKPRENSLYLKDSDFEKLTIMVNYSNKKTRNKDEVDEMKVSFWELNNNFTFTEDKTFINQVLVKLDELINNLDNEAFIEIPKKEIIKNYYEVVPVGIGLSFIRERLLNNYYQTPGSLLFDCRLIYLNSCIYNGCNTEFSSKAREIFNELQAKVKNIELNKANAYINSSTKNDIHQSESKIDKISRLIEIENTPNNSSNKFGKKDELDNDDKMIGKKRSLRGRIINDSETKNSPEKNKSINTPLIDGKTNNNFKKTINIVDYNKVNNSNCREKRNEYIKMNLSSKIENRDMSVSVEDSQNNTSINLNSNQSNIISNNRSRRHQKLETNNIIEDTESSKNQVGNGINLRSRRR